MDRRVLELPVHDHAAEHEAERADAEAQHEQRPPGHAHELRGGELPRGYDEVILARATLLREREGRGEEGREKETDARESRAQPEPGDTPGPQAGYAGTLRNAFMDRSECLEVERYRKCRATLGTKRGWPPAAQTLQHPSSELTLVGSVQTGAI